MPGKEIYPFNSSPAQNPPNPTPVDTYTHSWYTRPQQAGSIIDIRSRDLGRSAILVNNTPNNLHTFGLHPFTAFGMIAVDWMLFTAEGGTLNAFWPVSVAVAIALTIPCMLVQRYGYKDPWGLAIGKAMMVGVLTAIPTPLPSVVSLTGGALGAASMLLSGGKSPDR